MVRSEAQRTLIKSPLELWEELSDPASLARHLGEFGEIRITRVDQQRTLEWEADSLSGTIELLTAGWGTRVTLTVAADGQDAAGTASASDPRGPVPPEDVLGAPAASDPQGAVPFEDAAGVPPGSSPAETGSAPDAAGVSESDPAEAAPRSRRCRHPVRERSRRGN